MHGQISHLLQRKNGRISNSRTRMANALTSVHLSIHSPISVQATWHWRRGRWPIISANEQPPQRLPQRREPQWGSGSGGSSSPKYAGASAAGSIVCNRREGMLQSGNDTHTHKHTQAHTSTHTQTHTHKRTHTIALTLLHVHNHHSNNQEHSSTEGRRRSPHISQPRSRPSKTLETCNNKLPTPSRPLFIPTCSPSRFARARLFCICGVGVGV